MSIRVMAAVWDGFPGSGSELLALLALADWSDEDGRCFPSMAAIASKTRLSRSQAQRVVHGLIEAGHVEVTGNETGGPPGSTRQYRINLATMTGRVDATPTGRTHATGSVHATGRTGAQDGSHPCGKTGRTHATQTVSEPSTTVRGSNPDGLLVASQPATPDCPHQHIIETYHELLPSCPQVREWTPARQKLLRTRWTENAKRQSLAWWRKFFAYVAQSEFLTGRGSCAPGRDPFVADLEWLVRPSNFVKVIEGRYHRSEVAA